MNLLQALVLGFLQGVTEFLPISSTAHLRIVPALLGWPDPGAAFTAVTQLGTIAAVLAYFRVEVRRIALATLRSVGDRRLRSELDARIGRYIVLGSLPIAGFGLLFKDRVERGARDLYLIGTTLIVLGAVLLLAESVSSRRRQLGSISRRDGALIGIAQALALVPGVSRSGATISAGLFLGFERAAAARYSFLLSVPAITASGLFELYGIVSGATPTAVSLVPLAVATSLAAVVGYLSIAGLLRFLASRSTRVFVAYRVALGTSVIGLTAGGVIA